MLVYQFAEFFANFLKNPVLAIMNLIADLANFVIGTMQSIAKAIDAVFGTSLSGVVSGWSNSVNKFKAGIEQKDQRKFERIDASKYQLNHLSYVDSFQKGYGKGSALAGKVSSLISGGGIGGMNFGNIPAGAGTAGNPAAVKGTGKNGSMNVKLEDEDIDYLRELAERDYVARIAQNTLAPNIQVTFTGDISQEMDYEKIGPAVAQILQDEIDTAPEGLY